MERLGLWGAGSTFGSFEGFLDSLTKRGLGNYLIFAQKFDNYSVV